MSPEARAFANAAKAACAAAIARLRTRQPPAARIELLEAELLQAQCDIHLKMAEAYGQGYRDGLRDGRE